MKEKKRVEKNASQNMSYSEIISKHFASSACAFRVSQKDQLMTSNCPSSIVRKIMKLSSPLFPPCKKNQELADSPTPPWWQKSYVNGPSCHTKSLTYSTVVYVTWPNTWLDLPRMLEGNPIIYVIRFIPKTIY